MAQQQADALALLAEAALAPRARSRRPGRALPGGGPCRRRGAGGSGAARPVRARGRGARSRGNVAAPGVRREPGGDAARRGRAHRGGRGPDADDSARIAARAPPPRPGLPLPGLRAAGSGRAITSIIGRRAARPRSRISRCSVAGITARCTRRAIRSIDSPTARFSSGDRMASCSPTSRRRPRCPPIRSRRSARSTTRRGSACTRARPARPGWASDWIWVTRSPSCIPWPTHSRDRHGESECRHR